MLPFPPIIALLLADVVVLADGAPSGTVLGIFGIVLLAFFVGFLVVAFYAIRGIVRFVRRRR